MSVRLKTNIPIWLGFFALLMMQAGPLISGGQGMLSAPSSSVHAVYHQDAADSLAHADYSAHSDHYSMMGHSYNPHLPDWVNQLMMCGYCELLTFSPALLLTLLLALAPRIARPPSLVWVCPDFYSPCLRPYAAPRAPPFSA